MSIFQLKFTLRLCSPTNTEAFINLKIGACSPPSHMMKRDEEVGGGACTPLYNVNSLSPWKGPSYNALGTSFQAGNSIP